MSMHDRFISAEEFERRVEPRSRQSKLHPFWDDIQSLRAKNYTYAQICDFLAQNGARISIASLWAFIQRQLRQQELAASEAATPFDSAPASAPPSIAGLNKDESTPQRIHSHDPNEARPPPLTPRERREKLASQFVRDASSNPLLRKLQTKDQTK